MADLTLRRVRLLTNLVSLLLDLVMMDIVDLAMMILNWAVAIKSTWDMGGRHCSE